MKIAHWETGPCLMIFSTNEYFKAVLSTSVQAKELEQFQYFAIKCGHK